MQYPTLFFSMFAWVLAAPCVAQPGDSGRSPQTAFARLHDFVGSNELDFQTTIVSRDEYIGAAQGKAYFMIKPPNVFRIEGSLGRASYTLVSDGQTMTIYNPLEQRFVELPAPESPGEGLSLLVGLASAQARILDLVVVIREAASGSETIEVTPAGTSTIGGRQCDHFKIVETTATPVARSMRWEVWLEQKEPPVPCKFIVTSSDGMTTDVEVNEFSWKLHPVFSPEVFKFAAPAGSKRVDRVSELGLRPAF
jgi:outer membrane lipoprotein-sorting protein